MGRSNWNRTTFKNILIYAIPSGYEEGSYDRKDYMNEFPKEFENKTKDEIEDYFEWIKLQQFDSDILCTKSKINEINKKLCYLEFELIDGCYEGIQLDIIIKEQNLLNDAAYYENDIVIRDIKKDISTVIDFVSNIQSFCPTLNIGYDNYPFTTTVDFNDKEVQKNFKEDLYFLAKEMIYTCYELNSPFGDDEVFAKKIVDEALTIYFNKPNDKEAKLTNSL